MTIDELTQVRHTAQWILKKYPRITNEKAVEIAKMTYYKRDTGGM